MTDAGHKKLALAICDFLSNSIKTGIIKKDDSEGIEVAVQCIAEAFGVDPSNEQQVNELSVKPASLSSIFEVYLKTQEILHDKDDPKAKAEEFKSQGNRRMAEKKYAEAIDLYTKAIELDGQNPVFYANRAAAFSQNNEHEKAVDDAKKSLEIDRNYSKAYSRMGHAYFCLAKYQEAADSYQKGLELEPDNTTMKQSLATAKMKLDMMARAAEAPRAGPGGLDFSSIMSNPNFMNMAQSMMQNPAISSMLQNPAIAQMAQNLMTDPNALQNLLGNPDLQRMAQNFGGNPGSGPNANL